MAECYGDWRPAYRFAWPGDREAWAAVQHHPHPHVAQALAQARAVLPLLARDPRRPI
jgi:hypothetical protein